jgi:hypothetical protein
MQVKYIDMRFNLTLVCHDIADEKFHADVWVNPSLPPPDNRFTFDDAVAYIVDDLDFPIPETLVGSVLADETELAMFLELSSALNAMINRLGPYASYEEASASPEWDQAKSIARVLAEKLSTDGV